VRALTLLGLPLERPPALAGAAFAPRTPPGRSGLMRPSFRPSNDLVSHLGRGLHDLGVAALVGGNLFGRMALHPSVTRISDHAERGAVVNAAWRRYGIANSLGLAAVVGGWVAGRAGGEVSDRHLTARERRLARVKDGLVAATALTGLATAVEAIRFARQAPGGAVPLEDGDHAAPEAPDPAKRLKRRLNALGAANGGAEIALVFVNAALTQSGFRRPAARRLFWRGA
jgi:hypothetical protein